MYGNTYLPVIRALVYDYILGISQLCGHMLSQIYMLICRMYIDDV